MPLTSMEKLFRTINFIVIYLGVVKPKCIARATHPSNKKLELYMDLYTIAGASSLSVFSSIAPSL